MKSSTPILTYDASSFAMDSESDPCLHQTTDAEVIPPQETFYKDAAGTFDDAWEGTDGVEEVLPESPKKKRCILDSSADDDFSSSLSDANEKHVQDFFVEDEDASECKKHWERTGKKVITLLTMCYGSKGDTEFPFFDLDPYLSMKGRKKFLPTVKTMREELVRRSIAFHDVSGPRCKNWDKTRCMLEMKVERAHFGSEKPNLLGNLQNVHHHQVSRLALLRIHSQLFPPSEIPHHQQL